MNDLTNRHSAYGGLNVVGGHERKRPSGQGGGGGGGRRTTGLTLWQQAIMDLAAMGRNQHTILERFLKFQAAPDLVEFHTRLPANVATPIEAEDLNNVRIDEILAGTTDNLMYEFKSPDAAFTYYTGYVVFTDALDASLVDFKPTIEESRVLRYHGDPLANFKIDTSMTLDLGNNALVRCWLILKPGETFRWRVDNLQAVDTPMGVRMQGYVDFRTPKRNPGFGG